MATRNFRLPKDSDSSLGTVSIHIHSTNTKILRSEEVHHSVINLLKSQGLETGMIEFEQKFEASKSGILKTTKILFVVSVPTED